MNDLEEKKELLKDCLFNFEYSQVEIPETKLFSDGYKKIPIGELSGIGIAASSLASVFNNVTTTVINNGGETLLRPANVNVSELYKIGEGLVRGFSHDGSRFTKNGLFEVVQGGESVVKTTIAYNPAMLFVAGAIASISNNLETIKENQNKMLLHFEAEEKAELQGDLNVLLEELDKYKYYYK